MHDHDRGRMYYLGNMFSTIAGRCTPLWKHVAGLLLLGGVITGGILAGRLVARVGDSTPRAFSLDHWPARGDGEELIEFFDPACGASREAHKSIALLAKHYRHVLVAVSLAPHNGQSPGEMLCQIDPSRVFEAADAVVASDSRALKSFPQRRSGERCGRLVELATLETGRTIGGSPSTPLVVFRGVPYHGLKSLPELERQLLEAR